MKNNDIDIIRNTENEIAVHAKIAAMREPYRAMGERLHDLVMHSVPTLHPRVWYGMPGYAKTMDGPVICFFRAGRYMAFGLTEDAHLKRDDDAQHKLHGAAWYFSELDDATAEIIASVVRSAVQ